MATTGHARWIGGPEDGSGTIDTGSGPVTAGARTAAVHPIRLETVGTVPGIAERDVRAGAEHAKEQCPVSRALASVPEITADAKPAS